jgi:O-antigen/teichoic acid export membrane protein
MLLAFASLTNILFPFGRGIALARLLTPRDFGLAITATIVMSVAELITDMGITQMAVKADAARDIDTLHSLAVVRGTVLCVGICLCGPVFGFLFHAPDAWWIYSIVGVVSLLRSLGHLDVKLQTRSYNYLADALASSGSQIIWTMVTIGAAIALRDYRAMIFGLLAYAASYIMITHAMASSSWRLGWDRRIVSHAIAFGRPLAINGIAYSLVSLGDRTLTGAKMSLGQLAQYTALTTSAFLPRSAIASFFNGLFLPHFINTRDEELRRIGDLWFIIASLLAGIFGCGYLAIGKIVTRLVFGHAYEIDQTTVSLVGLLGTIRYVTVLPTPPCLAFSRGDLLLRFTFLSTGGLALGAILIVWHPSLNYLVSGMSAGETVALAWLVVQLRKLIPTTDGVAWTAAFYPLVSVAGFALLLWRFDQIGLALQILLGLIGMSLQVAVSLYLLHLSRLSLRDMLGSILPARKSRPDFATSQP